MKTELTRKYFRRFLETGGWCTPPGRTACALESAKTLIAWEQAESAGLVRIQAEPESQSMADVYGTEIAKNEADFVERFGCWSVYSEVNHGTESTGDDWVIADSVGMCVFKNPCDPFDNPYVIGLMQSALNQIPQPGNVDELCTAL